MSVMLRRLIAPLAVLGLAIGAGSAQSGDDQKSDKTEKAPAEKAKQPEKAKGEQKTERLPRVGGGIRPIGEKAEKHVDPTLSIPSMQKLREAEEAYRKARDVAAKDIDAAIEKAEASLAEAHKNMTGKDVDKDARAKAQTAAAKLNHDIQSLRSARYKVHSPHLPMPQPQESRLAAKLDKVGELVAVQLKLEKGQGLVVVSVDKDGAADKAGLKVNDILVAIEGKNVSSDLKDLRKILSEIQPDTTVSATVLRAGAREKIGELKLPAATSK